MSAPRPLLRALTPETQDAIEADEVEICAFPFRVGRESRSGKGLGLFRFRKRRSEATPPNNDLYMTDFGKRLSISREHFQIEQREDGSFELVDRGSMCGTIVDGEVVGGQSRGGRCLLEDGDVIVVGKSKSPYLFKFLVPHGRA